MRLGISSTLAVLSHEIAQEIADFSLLRHAGRYLLTAVLYSINRTVGLSFEEALRWNTLVSFSALGGWTCKSEGFSLSHAVRLQ